MILATGYFIDGAIMTDTSETADQPPAEAQIEGRVLDALFRRNAAAKTGDEVAGETLDATIRRRAVDDGGDGPRPMELGTEALKRGCRRRLGGGGAMASVKGQSERHLDFDVRRCGYAGVDQSLGLADLGYRIHCNRDHAAMVTGFDDKLELSRSQTIMQGAAHRDFRFRSKS